MLLTGVIAAGCIFINYAVAQDTLHNPYITREAHDAVVRSFESQVNFLKWIGISIVTALIGALGLLWRSLEKANGDSRNDLIEGIKRRERILEEHQTTTKSSNEALGELSKNIAKLLLKKE